MKRDPHCKLCPLHQTAEHVCLLGNGPSTAKAMIIGEAPGKREDDTGKPFVGRAGKLLDQILANVGLSRKDVFITNAVSCRPPGNRTPRKTEIQACKKWLDYQIKKVKPRFLLLLGNVPLQSVLDLKGIRKLRGRPVEHQGMIVLPTYHPSYALHDDRQLPKIEHDFQRFKDIIDFGGIPEERGLNVTIVDNWGKVDKMLDAMTGIVSGDIETTCLYPFAKEARIVSLGFGTAQGEFSIPVNHRDSPWTLPEIDDIIETIDDHIHNCDQVVWQGGKFDILWLKQMYGVDWPNDFDTMLAHYILDENSLHDIEHLAKLYFGAHSWDVPLEVKQGKTGDYHTLAKYHAHDLHYTRKLYFKLSKMLDEDIQVNRVFRRIVMPCSNLFAKRIEFNGCYVQTKRMKEVETKLLDTIANAERRLRKWGKINWSSPKQVAKLLYTDLKIPIVEKTKKGAASTSESCLKRIDHPAVKDLLKFRGAKQQLSFFIEGWKPYIVNSRIHPSFKLHGTVTGRLSCEHPNFQQVPRDVLIRSLISAPPGWQFVEGDLSQIELRVAAELSGDLELNYCFDKGIDVHWRTMINSITSGTGEYHDEVIKTVGLYCVQHGLPANRTSTEILLNLWESFKGGEEPEKILRLCSKNWEDQKSGRRQRWGPGEWAQSVLERWMPDLASQKVPKKVLSALQEYIEYRTASQGQQPKKLEKIKFDDALSLLSRIGPSNSQELSSFWKEGRKKAKAVGFGFLFGMYPKKFKVYARDNYGIDMSEAEAKTHRGNFFNLYKGLEPWHKQQKNFARQHGFVRSLSGRKRRLPKAMISEDTPERAEAWRQAINSPVQSFANELNLMCLLQLSREYKNDVFRPCMTVHDQVGAEIREDKLVEICERWEEIMKGPDLLKTFDIKLSVPICGEVKIGPWGSGVSLIEWRKRK